MENQQLDINLVSYEKQKEFDQVMKLDGLFVIIGCGGIGFWAAILLAMIGKKSFCFIDGDKIEATNLNRLPVPQTWIGKEKVVVLARIIRWLRPETKIMLINKNLEEYDFESLNSMFHNKFNDKTIVIDCTDNALIQKKIYNYFKKKAILKYIKIGYEGFTIGSYPTFDVFIGENYQGGGYRTTSANAISSVTAASMGLFNLFLGNGKDKEYNLKEIVL